jgi:hypothetical protein
MNWIIEGSIDGENWIELDRRDDCREVVGVNRSATFQIEKREFVRLVRLRHYGKNSNGYDYLTVSAFELFGNLR